MTRRMKSDKLKAKSFGGRGFAMTVTQKRRAKRFALCLSGFLLLGLMGCRPEAPAQGDWRTLPLLTDNADRTSEAYEKVKTKLLPDENASLKIDENGAVVYGNWGLEEEGFSPVPTDAEAAAMAEQALADLGLLPQGDYRIGISRIQRTGLDLNGGEAASETIEITARFYRTCNGVDVLSDKKDGILLCLQKGGIARLHYLWRDMETAENPRENPDGTLPLDQAKAIWQRDFHTALRGEIPENPVITTAYLQRENTVSPVWVFSTDEDYINPICVDMYTGEFLSLLF